MKRFFPSSVMLTPFVVKHYSEPEQGDTNKGTSPNPVEKTENEKKKHIKKKQ
ncbi:hypothetical protein HRJ45_01575 [Vibrio coralliilyticus]|uniref:hypothetical protein n=1 Tax=Vibrio coralliilyticus TaxID=190893 RepID=UPI000A818DAD|nr:hypothetical protein [Vibrio coralliilyticus]NRF23509.1 hypothetical protein [Vibrio coralliilyticus]NRF77780.1 hypothetical protein [Vibrio coralliilyticus]